MSARDRSFPTAESGPAAMNAPETGTCRVLLIIPCFNEEENVSAVLEEAAQLGSGYDTLVIDDGSTDRTYETARSYSKAIRLVRNLGIGGAVQTGIKYAHRQGYDYCVQVDGDGQHPPREVARLLAIQHSSGANIVIGSRYLEGEGFRSTRMRRLGSRLIALALRKLFRSGPVTDPTSGLRLMDRQAMAFFAESYPQDYPEPISLAWALKRGLSIREVPVEMRSREKGSSSINKLRPLAYMVRVLGYIVLARLARPR
jgi:glycosyltransferase involved in cell wall biosynthesis